MSSFADQESPIRTYLDQIGRWPLLTPEREIDLARRWNEHRDARAAQELVERNLRFVVKIALKYRRYGLPMADLIQEGNLGLMRAVERFDPARGTRLISYAVFWIKAFIQSHVLHSWSVVRVGTTQSQRRLFYRIPKALAAEGGTREAKLRALAEELGVDFGLAERMSVSLSGRDLSLDAPMDDDGGTTWGERVEDDGADPEQNVLDAQEDSVRQNALEGALALLSERERAILDRRHRVEEPQTLRQVGAAMGMSRERVRQLEAQALRKVTNVARARCETRRHAA